MSWPRKHICTICRRPCVGHRCITCYRRKSNKGKYTTEYDTGHPPGRPSETIKSEPESGPESGNCNESAGGFGFFIKKAGGFAPQKLEMEETMRLDFILDAWQKDVLAAEGNLCICSGRQVGKSRVIAIKTGEYIANHEKKKVLVVSITEDQAELMIQKVLIHLHDNYPKLIAKGKNKPTKHVVRLTNGSEVRSKAVGQYGLGILGLTIDVLVPDEAAYMPEAIWAAATPMLLTTGGQIWLLSTPNARSGYFYDAYTDPRMGFKTFHVNSEEVAEARPMPLKRLMLDYLAREKQRMTALQYAQQYLAQFLEELGQLFPDDLIESGQTLKRSDMPPAPGEFYLGVDVARMGGDESTFEVLEKVGERFFHRENLMFTYTLTTETIAKVLELDEKYQFVTIYIDDGGLGVAVFDQLLKEEQTRRKVVAINNASRALDRDLKRRKKLLKEDLYLNLKRMLESKQIELLDDIEVFTSLKSIIIEHTAKTGEIRIYGRYSHIAEGIIRAAWCVRNTHLNIFFERV